MLLSAGLGEQPERRVGDTWDVWKEDFFKPGDALLAAAPWIMDRGNHEECERGGKGWARVLDPYGSLKANSMIAPAFVGCHFLH